MLSAESDAVGSDPAVGEAHSRSPVSKVKARLSPIPDAPDFQVMLTLHHSDGSRCEVALTPIEASILVSELAHALGEGDRDIAATAGDAGLER